ncbi:hypothetical protein SDC9_58277 [bioreactor metagenome]|uniref:Anti-bacteriophage protein A/HamA C-terminal domain-containing protein n=1 Tax=bioreactor metagenome TaxID=1076179 RepID=A0A644X6X3_9ZZZZ
MRDALKHAVKDAICIECKLPHNDSGVGKSCLSTQEDVCFNNAHPQDIARVIYNGIVEFAVNEYEIDYDNLELEQRKAIIRRIRYNPVASTGTKIKYGFYGEVLLDLILRCFMKTNVLLARGYFYSVLENSEVKGFDAFHLIENDDRLDLWLGEAKFYIAYKKPITDVLEKLKISLSDEYVSKNLLALIDWQDRFTTTSERLKTILDQWEKSPNINLAQEMTAHQIRLTYPVFIAYEKTNLDDYHHSIGKCIDHIASEFVRLNINISASFNYRLFFMFLPLSEVKRIKESVITWIDSQEPLI